MISNKGSILRILTECVCTAILTKFTTNQLTHTPPAKETEHGNSLQYSHIHIKNKFTVIYILVQAKEWNSLYSNGLWVGWPGFNSQQEQGILFYSTASRQDLGPIHPPYPANTGGSFIRVK
jgi:hypothetical protein